MIIKRTKSTDEGTLGVLQVGNFTCFTIECPWLYNMQGVSCIPAGVYNVEPWSSATYKEAYHVMDVPGRSAILIHQGNWAGDVEKGYRSNSRGCILPGDRIAYINGQLAVTSSLLTLRRLIQAAGKEPFTLTIEDVI